MFKKIIHRYILVAVLVVALFGAPFIASALPEGVSKAIKSNVDKTFKKSDINNAEYDKDIRNKGPLPHKPGAKWYFTKRNVYYPDYAPTFKKMKSGMYITGNCTWYAYGRISERWKSSFLKAFRWDAGRWWQINKQGNYFVATDTPMAGDIACFSTHVSIVEKVVDGKPIYSKSGWKTSKVKPKNVNFDYGEHPWGEGLKGFIHVPDHAVNQSAPKNIKGSIANKKYYANSLLSMSTSAKNAAWNEINIYRRGRKLFSKGTANGKLNTKKFNFQPGIYKIEYKARNGKYVIKKTEFRYIPKQRRPIQKFLKVNIKDLPSVLVSDKGIRVDGSIISEKKAIKSLRCVLYYGDGRVRFEKNIPVGRKQVTLGDRVQFTLPSFAKGEYALRIFANVNGKEHEAVQHDFFVANRKKGGSKFSIKSDEKGLGKGQTITLKWNDSKASGYAVKVIRRKGKFTGVVATGLTQDRSFDFVARGSGTYRAYVYPYSHKGEAFKMQTIDIKIAEKPDVPKKYPVKTIVSRGYKYEVYKEKTNVKQALARALARGGRLAAANSKTDIEDMQKAAKSAKLKTWVGASNSENHEHRFRWLYKDKGVVPKKLWASKFPQNTETNEFTYFDIGKNSLLKNAAYDTNLEGYMVQLPHPYSHYNLKAVYDIINRQVILTWDKLNGVDKVIVMYSPKKKGLYEKIAECKGDASRYILKPYSQIKKGYYKIVAVQSFEGRTIFSKHSKPVNI